eukprot:GFUD01040447.1.p1 GENE.GFUD01040447.1~~GFUD01040447.1.p1  ORF type:complete len:532 (-),score=105.34 GFUD01040447.1:24-1418(-)
MDVAARLVKLLKSRGKDQSKIDGPYPFLHATSQPLMKRPIKIFTPIAASKTMQPTTVPPVNTNTPVVPTAVKSRRLVKLFFPSAPSDVVKSLPTSPTRSMTTFRSVSTNTPIASTAPPSRRLMKSFTPPSATPDVVQSVSTSSQVPTIPAMALTTFPSASTDTSIAPIAAQRRIIVKLLTPSSATPAVVQSISTRSLVPTSPTMPLTTFTPILINTPIAPTAAPSRKLVKLSTPSPSTTSDVVQSISTFPSVSTDTPIGPTAAQSKSLLELFTSSPSTTSDAVQSISTSSPVTTYTSIPFKPNPVSISTSSEQLALPPILMEVPNHQDQTVQAEEDLSKQTVVEQEVKIKDSAIYSQVQTVSASTAPPRSRKIFFGPSFSVAKNSHVPFSVEVARFRPDDEGSIHLVTKEGRSLAASSRGALIPVLETLPAGLAPTFKITPVFITGLGDERLSTMIQRPRRRFF